MQNFSNSKMSQINQFVDWYYDDGINIGMISDYNRNIFYQKILKEVKNKKCIEVGFGTGLLSILTLQNGADSVLAYENNKERFIIGQAIIERLGLNNRIQLLNESFKFDADFHSDYDLIFHEILGTNLFNEGVMILFNIDKKILPSRIGTEWYIHPIEQNDYDYSAEVLAHQSKILSHAIDFYLAIKDPSWPICKTKKDFEDLPISIKQECKCQYNFDCDTLASPLQILTGVEQIEEYESIINAMISDWWVANIDKKIFKINTNLPDNSASMILKTEVDFNKNIITSDRGTKHIYNELDRYLVETIDESSINSLYYAIKVRHYISHNDKKLYLDENHWGSSTTLSLVKNTKQKLLIRQNLTDGKIDYYHQ